MDFLTDNLRNLSLKNGSNMPVALMINSTQFEKSFLEKIQLPYDNDDFGTFRVLYDLPDEVKKDLKIEASKNYSSFIIINFKWIHDYSVDPKHQNCAKKLNEERQDLTDSDFNVIQESMRVSVLDLLTKLKDQKLQFGIDVHKALADLLEKTNLGHAFLENAVLANYHYKVDERNKFSTICFPEGKFKVAAPEIFGESQNICRFLTDAPANIITPIGFIDYIKKYIAELGLENAIELIIRDKNWMKENNFNLLLAVASGSIDCQPPYFLEMHINKKSADSKPKLALVGKGITFDTGAYTLKDWQGMAEMRSDMGGAAICALAIIAQTRLQQIQNSNNSGNPLPHFCALLPLTENMVSGASHKPFDVVTSHSGKTVCLADLDAEGRLVMSDALAYSDKTLQAEYIMNIATLTGSVEAALGRSHTGVWGTSLDFYKLLEKAGNQSLERFQLMPLLKMHKDAMSDIDYADTINWIDQKPGATLAAAFCSHFVENKNWLHLDVGGSMEAKGKECPFISEDMFSGRPVRAIIQLLQNFCE